MVLRIGGSFIAVCLLLAVIAPFFNHRDKQREAELSGTLEGRVQIVAEDAWGRTASGGADRGIQITKTGDSKIGYWIRIEYLADDGFSKDGMRRQIYRDLFGFLKKEAVVPEFNSSISAYFFCPRGETTDRFKNSSTDILAQIKFDRAILRKINWDKVEIWDFEKILKSDATVDWYAGLGRGWLDE